MPDRESDPTSIVHNIPTIAGRIRALDENDTPISGLNLRTIASAIRHKDSTTGQTVATALDDNNHVPEDDDEGGKTVIDRL